MSYSIYLARLAEASAITRLLNKVTLDLLEKGERQWPYPWRLKAIQKEIGLGNTYTLVKGQQLVGVFFLQTKNALPGITFPKKSLYLSKMAVVPSQQGQNYGQLILDYCRELSRQYDLPVYLECSLSNQELRHFFSLSGCEHLGTFSEQELFKLKD